jgi:hypothetical protein
MESLTTFMNTLSFNELSGFEIYTLIDNTNDKRIDSRYRNFIHSIIQFSKNLEQHLQEEIMSTLYYQINIGGKIPSEVEHYRRIINIYTNLKSYLIQLSQNKMIETHELNTMLDVQPPTIPNVIDLLTQIKRDTTLDPTNETYADLSLYSRDLLVILDSLITYILDRYNSTQHICSLAFPKRAKFIICTYNIIMSIFYILIHRNHPQK